VSVYLLSLPLILLIYLWTSFFLPQRIEKEKNRAAPEATENTERICEPAMSEKHLSDATDRRETKYLQRE
jgi:hypothetical protein